MLEAILTKLAEHGAIGLLTAGLFVALLRKDKELALERAARIEDNKALAVAALAMQEKLLTAVHSFEAASREQLAARRTSGGQYR